MKKLSKVFYIKENTMKISVYKFQIQKILYNNCKSEFYNFKVQR